MAELKIKTQTVYETSDEKTFLSVADARNHQLRLDLIELAQEKGICSGGNWSLEEVVEAFWEDRAELHRILARWADGELA